MKTIYFTTLAAGVFLYALSLTAGAEEYPQFDNLKQGRALWLENCEGCHAWGIAGAPIPMVAEEWAPRLKQPLSVLYDHAINGFFGPDDTMMPARGGNDSLADAEVMSAVDYMLEYARSHQSPKP